MNGPGVTVAVDTTNLEAVPKPRSCGSVSSSSEGAGSRPSAFARACAGGMLGGAHPLLVLRHRASRKHKWVVPPIGSAETLRRGMLFVLSGRQGSVYKANSRQTDRQTDCWDGKRFQAVYKGVRAVDERRTRLQHRSLSDFPQTWLAMQLASHTQPQPHVVFSFGHGALQQ